MTIADMSIVTAEVKVDETDKSGDFSAAKAEIYSEPAAPALQVELKHAKEPAKKNK